MMDCARLLRADNITALYSEVNKALIISVDVIVNRYIHHVHICRNPLERLLPVSAMHEYMVVGTTSAGIHPELVSKRTISASFGMDETPEKVAVYSIGVDNPARVEVSVHAQCVLLAPSRPSRAAPQSKRQAGQRTSCSRTRSRMR